MNNRNIKNINNEMVAQVIIPDIRSGIDLDGSELLKLDPRQPGTRVICTAGTLWLTQQSDLNDHLIKAGQSFTIDKQGIVLVQGLPCGKVFILPPTTVDIVKLPLYNKHNCSSEWDNARI
jgi:hypothetical protein